jgi:G3E family GTPase
MNQDEDEITFVEPVYAPWDGRRVPVVLLSGYLGAGKTTVINEMLGRTDLPIAVFVNDVGAINIDAKLIRKQDGDTLDLTGGCVCCSLKNGFLEAFDQIRSREVPPELVVVELSGVADPRAAASMCGTPGFVVDGIVVLVDLEQFLDQAAAESVMGDSVRAQVGAADLLLLAKRDLVDTDQIAAVTDRLAELAPGVPTVLADSAFSAAGLIGLATRRPVVELDAGMTLFDQHSTSIIPIGGAMLQSELQELVDGLGPEVVRAKGIVQIETGQLMVVQVVGGRRTIEPLPMAEVTEPTDLVVISV